MVRSSFSALIINLVSAFQKILINYQMGTTLTVRQWTDCPAALERIIYYKVLFTAGKDTVLRTDSFLVKF